MKAILTDEAERRRLVATERQLLEDLRIAVAAFDGEAADLTTLRDAAANLDELFLLVIVGEFNAGKSAVINALVGATVAPEGILPTTAEVTILRYGAQPSRTLRPDGAMQLEYPAEFLRTIAIVDTPGTNAIVRTHEEITERFAPRADLALFVTSADRPFTESERAFMERLRGWGKPVVVVLNKTDLLAGQAQVAELVAFIEENARRLLGFTPHVVPVSARLARQAQAIENEQTRAALEDVSGFAALRAYVFETLDEASRIRYKLLSPLGVADAYVERYAAAATAREALLSEDRKTEDAIDRQIAAFASETRRAFEARLGKIDAIVYAMNDRADRFFEETMRIGRIPDLLNAAKVKSDFEHVVVADSERRIDDAVRDLVDAVVDAENRLWLDVSDYLGRRMRADGDARMLGRIGASTFAQDRRAILDAATQAARNVVERYDRDREASELAASLRDAVAQTGLVGAGGVGLGALVVMLVGGAAADITGVLAGVALAGLALYILPSRRRKASVQFRNESASLLERLHAAITEQFDRQLDAALTGTRGALSPYVRFVRAEQEHISAFSARLVHFKQQSARLRYEIGGP